MLYFLFSVFVTQAQQVYINEFMASNSIMNPDPDFQEFPDWIELYNASATFSRAPAVTLSLEAGFYDRQQVLELSIDDPAAVIRYTLDGSDPSENSPVYTVPLSISNRTGKNRLILNFLKPMEQQDSPKM